jgi:Uma2 family endonuclease
MQMLDIKLMATTDRYSDLVDGFTGNMYLAKKKGDLTYWSSTVALVYTDEYNLINVNEISRAEENKLGRQLTKMRFVEPDVMVFKENAFISNLNGTRKAGCPDLIVEVWSDDNNAEHRQKKFEIYQSSATTEHWYLEQRSDIVKCFKGEIRLPDQHLKNILKTQNGLEFDVSELQTGDDTSWNDFLEYGFK